jgi:PAS domain S-box-containing protein
MKQRRDPIADPEPQLSRLADRPNRKSVRSPVEDERMDLLPQIVWKANPDGAICYFNRRWQAYTDLEPERSLGWAFLEAVHPEDRHNLQHTIAGDRVASPQENRGDCQEVAFRLRGWDGAYRWMLAQANAKHDKNGQIVEWWGTYTDIHPFKQAVRYIERRQSYLAECLQQLSVWMGGNESNFKNPLKNNPKPFKAEEYLRQGLQPIGSAFARSPQGRFANRPYFPLKDAEGSFSQCDRQTYRWMALLLQFFRENDGLGIGDGFDDLRPRDPNPPNRSRSLPHHLHAFFPFGTGTETRCGSGWSLLLPSTGSSSTVPSHPALKHNGHFGLVQPENMPDFRRMNDDPTPNALRTPWREKQRLYRAVVDALKEGILVHFTDGTIAESNHRAQEILGRSAEQIEGRSYSDSRWRAIREDGSPFDADTHPVRVALESGRSQLDCTIGIHQPDGKLCWLSLDCIPLFHPGEPRPYAVVSAFTEIAKDRQRERALPEREPSDLPIAEYSNDLISRHDREGVYLYASPACRHLLGYEPEELVGHHWREFFHPEDLATWEIDDFADNGADNGDRAGSPQENRDPSRTLTYRHCRKDGSYIWFETTMRRVRYDRDGIQETETIAVSRDITARKQQEAEIRALNAELDRLLRKQSLQLEATKQLKDELVVREKSALQAAEAAEARLSNERAQIAASRLFQSRASTLLAASLDYQTTLENLADAIVPELADWCAIDAIETPSGTTRGATPSSRCLAVGHVDPAKKEQVWELQRRYPVDADGTYPYFKSLAASRSPSPGASTGVRPDAVFHLTEAADYCLKIEPEELDRVAVDPEQLELLRSLGCSAYICLPIRFGHQTFGSILLVRGSSGRSSSSTPGCYTEADLAVAEDLARRAALAIEKALLYREAQETGERLRKTVASLDEQKRQLSTLQQLANRLNQQIADLPELLQLMVESVCNAIPSAEFCAIVLHDHDSDVLQLRAAAGSGTEHLPLGKPLATQDSLLHEVFFTGTAHLRQHPIAVGREGEGMALGEIPAAVYAVPIESAQAGRLGVLLVGNWQNAESFDLDSRRQMVVAVGEQAAIAINNARSIEILEEREQLLEVQNQILARQNQELDAKRKQIELQNARLREASRLKSQFLATMSHELRTPMNAALGFAQVLLRSRRHPLAAQQQQMVERIVENGRHLLRLIDDIIDLSKIEGGNSQLKLQEFELDLLVRASCEELRNLADRKNLALEIDIDLSDATVYNDRLRLRQAIANLLSNAIKFTESGSIRVEVSEIGSEAIAITLIDTGIGIPKADLNHIFEAFRQVDQTTTRKYSGTGLGLAIANSLVTLMQGKITVESELGQGSKFRIELPRRVLC